MNFRRFLDAAEALLVEAYTSMPHVDLMTAIRETSEYRMAGIQQEPEEPAPVGNDAALTEFESELRGLRRA